MKQRGIPFEVIQGNRQVPVLKLIDADMQVGPGRLFYGECLARSARRNK